MISRIGIAPVSYLHHLPFERFICSRPLGGGIEAIIASHERGNGDKRDARSTANRLRTPVEAPRSRLDRICDGLAGKAGACGSKAAEHARIAH